MNTQPLNRHRRRERPGQVFLGELSLTRGRVHEFCGNARRTLAMMLAANTRGPVFWISPGWAGEQLNPEAMVQFANPGRFTFVSPQRRDDILWCMEEILRSSAVALVVADLPMPASLTPVRRLHLAAESAQTAPLGILLSGGDGGSQGVESRWQLDAETPGWVLERLRARTQPPKSWKLGAKSLGKYELSCT